MEAAEIRSLIADVVCNEIDLRVEIDDSEIERVTSKVTERLASTLKLEAEIDYDSILSKLHERIKPTLKPVIKRIDVSLPSGKVSKVEGPIHPAFERCLMLAKRRKNIMLVGPSGCGKTHLAAQLAKALALPFYSISCSAGMSEGQLLGRLLPVGKGGAFSYVRADFVRAFEEGGVFLLDELDSADANTLLILNSALANGTLSVPNRPEKPTATRHPDFICIAAANTYGNGADRQYVGRNALDKATLDRFKIGTVSMDYDATLEAALCPDDALRARLTAYRTQARAHRLEQVVSMRFLADAFEMKQEGMTDEEIDETLFADWSKDECKKVRGF